MKANDNQACNFFFSLKISGEISQSFLTRYPLSSPMMLNIDRKSVATEIRDSLRAFGG